MIEFYLSEIAPVLNGIILGHDVQFKGCSTDTRRLIPGSIYIALRGEHFDGHDFVTTAQQQGAVAVLVDRPVACGLPALRVENTRKALGELAQLWRQRFDLPVVAITGSNGKTTTKEMLKAIFTQMGPVLASSGNFNNDIGVPLTLFNLDTTHRYAVIEMGANHAGEIKQLSHMAMPTVATITQCAPAHLEGFQNIDGVALAKGEIFIHLQTGGTAVINHDDVYAELWCRQIAAADADAPPESSYLINTFALHRTADVMAQELQLHPDSSDFILQTVRGTIPIHLPLPGKHNVLNALTAGACALACGCSLTVIQQGLQQIQPVAGRLQRYEGFNQTLLIDDSYNANPASLNAALAVLGQHPPPYWLILGDMNELGERSVAFHQQAGRLAREVGVERLWAMGNMSRYAVESFGVGALHFVHHDDLITALRAQLPLGATLLIKGSRSMQMEKVVLALREEK